MKIKIKDWVWTIAVGCLVLIPLSGSGEPSQSNLPPTIIAPSNFHIVPDGSASPAPLPPLTTVVNPTTDGLPRSPGYVVPTLVGGVQSPPTVEQTNVSSADSQSDPKPALPLNDSISNLTPSPGTEWLTHAPELRNFMITNLKERLDLQTKDARIQNEYTQKYYEWQTRNLDRTGNALDWNKWQSIVIFIVAHLLLMIGIAAAIREFRSSMELRQKSRSKDEINITLEGVALKTSLRAIWLLLSALAFYYVYIKFVYTITVIK